MHRYADHNGTHATKKAEFRIRWRLYKRSTRCIMLVIRKSLRRTYRGGYIPQRYTHHSWRRTVDGTAKVTFNLLRRTPDDVLGSKNSRCGPKGGPAGRDGSKTSALAEARSHAQTSGMAASRHCCVA